MLLVVLLSAVSPSPPSDNVPTLPIPGGREVIESATWLSRQQISVWFAIVVILMMALIYMIIRFLLKERSDERKDAQVALTAQRVAHNEERARDREAMLALQTTGHEMQLQLVGYLEKDHQQTVVLLKESQIVMQEVVGLLKEIKLERHDDELMRQQNNKMLQKLDQQREASHPTQPPK